MQISNSLEFVLSSILSKTYQFLSTFHIRILAINQIYDNHDSKKYFFSNEHQNVKPFMMS